MPDAQYNLGVIYHERSGACPKDYAEAVKWFRMAAEQGDVMAQFNLGVMYENFGQGVPEDDMRAYAWFNLATAQRLRTGRQGKGKDFESA